MTTAEAAGKTRIVLHQHRSGLEVEIDPTIIIAITPMAKDEYGNKARTIITGSVGLHTQAWVVQESLDDIRAAIAKAEGNATRKEGAPDDLQRAAGHGVRYAAHVRCME